MTEPIKTHGNSPFIERDPIVTNAGQGEKKRQQNQVAPMVSENLVGAARLDALRSVITNKAFAGYPSNRSRARAAFADLLTSAAIDRTRPVVGWAFAKMEPHPDVHANQAVFLASREAGDVALGPDRVVVRRLNNEAKDVVFPRSTDSERRG